ncbi:zinc finger protein 497-like isoform X2 [Aricia agestis]|nr:zinc finger protein 497-like isoform X2 [Aricia agestis]
MMAEVQVKIEPRDPEEDENEPQDLTTSGPSFHNFVGLQPEPVDIKTEPASDNEVQSSDDEPLFPHTQIKIEPCNENGTDEYEEEENFMRPERSKPRKRKESSDEDFTLASYKKKLNKKKGEGGNIKPSMKGRSRAGPEMIYKDEIISQIEIETITEEERQSEHQEVLETRRHMRFLCEWCAVGFVIEDAYQVHMKLHTQENGTHECELCHMWVRNSDVLYRHRLRHYRRYRCVVCGLRLRDKDTAAAHIMSDHQGTSFPCPHCDKGFKRPQYLRRHIAQMHTRATEYKCPVCGRVFYERGWFRCHVRSHNEEVQMCASQSLPCTQCGRVFRQRSNLKRHMLTHVREPVPCPHCDVTADNPELLRMHCIKLHPELVGDADTICVHCGRACATIPMLHRHLRRMHADRTKRFECDHCSRRYLTKGEVRSHIMWSHLRRLGGHACDCGRVFRNPARLRHHQRIHHLRLEEPRDKHCPVCGKAFANQQVLTRHIRGHSGTTYPCQECGQTFKTQSYVKVHYKIKHLNMTRAQVKAESKRKLLMVDNADDPPAFRRPPSPRTPDPPSFGQPPSLRTTDPPDTLVFPDVGGIKREIIEVPK